MAADMAGVGDYENLIQGAASQYDVDPQLLRATMQVESGGNPNAIGPPVTLKDGSVVRAQGLMQFLPGTAKTYGVDVSDPRSSVYGAARYISDLLDQYKNMPSPVDAAMANYGGYGPTYGQKIVAAYRQVQAPKSGARAVAPPPPMPVPSKTPQMTPDEQSLLVGGKDAPAPTPAPSPARAAPAGPVAQTHPQLTPEEQQLLTPPPAATSPSPPAPAPPSPQQNLTAWTPGRAIAGEPSAPLFTPEQQQTFAGFEHGAREAINPLLESGSWVGNQIAKIPGLENLQTDRAAADVANEQQFQQQYGQSPFATGAARAARVAIPLVAGGATSAALRGGLALAGLPETGAWLSGAPTAGGWINRLTSGVASGAIQGGVTGGLPGAATGATIGGATLPIAGGVANWVGQRINPATAAARRVLQAIQRDGTTPQQLDQAIQQLGPRAILADVGDANVRQLAEGVANAPGPGQQVARTYLTARAEAQAQHLDDAVRTATGATGSAFDTMENLQTARRAAATPAYERAFANEVPTAVQAARLDQFISTPIGQRALQDGIANMRFQALADGQPFRPADYGVTQNPDGTYSLAPGVPNLRLYDAVKRGFDNFAEEFRDATTGRMNLSGTVSVPSAGNLTGSTVNNVRNTYTQTLRTMFPEYARALDAWGGPSADMQALSMGRRFLSADADATADAVSRLSPSQRDMYLTGVAQQLRDRIQGTADEADATRRIFGNDLVRSKLAAALGGENTPAYQRFRDSVEAEAQFAQTNRQFLQGPATARRITGIQQAQGAPPPAHVILPAAIHAVTGNPLAAAAHVAQHAAPALINRLVAPSDQYNLALGRMLFDPTARDETMNILNRGFGPSVGDRIRGWQGQQGLQFLLNARNRLQGPQAVPR